MLGADPQQVPQGDTSAAALPHLGDFVPPQVWGRFHSLSLAFNPVSIFFLLFTECVSSGADADGAGISFNMYL